ncbi:ribosomal protein S12 methylthiotransferase accessory factor YcaO [Rhodoferax ferrireducens]|uniref:Ribosomal protein S12 methylthiotransferase accessory factor YcaO n=1 Tax=Rhodoferax ferrireducens TaxID=192843 RepID=A0ABU2CFH2_9BURK|nr:hypothetical protein [Rhodoferax ferrireducens]MDR7380084.1 ribosomal protein S12 methylthiotransferase accessory factor YcaO [Rhodoferax ferrireducens]
MSGSAPHEDADGAPLRALAEALQGMRDAWVRASLFLHELQFQIDTDQRSAANDQLQKLLDRINGR